jgi:nucleotide-binding universal stress UspA family protein
MKVLLAVDGSKYTKRMLGFRHCAGHAAKEIATLGDKEHFDLIVLGSHGHTGLGGLVLGSVATAVLASCTTPVLIVRGTQA